MDNAKPMLNLPVHEETDRDWRAILGQHPNFAASDMTGSHKEVESDCGNAHL